VSEVTEHGLGPAYAVRFHCTDIVTFYRNGRCLIDTGGWRTITTVARIADYSPAHVYRQQNQVYISGCDHTGAKRGGRWGRGVAMDDRYPLNSSVMVGRDGLPVGPADPVDVDRMRRQHAEVREARNARNRGRARCVRAEKRWDDYMDGKRKTVPLRDMTLLRNARWRADFMREFGSDAVIGALPIMNEGPVEVRFVAGRDHEYQIVWINIQTDDDPRSHPYLRMINPTTGETCLEAVGPHCLDVDQALQFRNGTAELPITLT